jgi:peptide deformylase
MQEITVEGTELLARAICHELDHLDGVLYKDKVNDGLHRVQPMDPDDMDDEEFDDEFEDEE